MRILRAAWEWLGSWFLRTFMPNRATANVGALHPVNQERAAWFDARYDIAAQRVMGGNARFTIGDRQSRACRYCERRKPEVSFKKEAHAFPESIGNKWLISFDECDACNDLFSAKLEDDFGKFTGPMRTMGRILGKGFPTFKSSDGDLRVEVDNIGFLRMSIRHDGPRYEMDETNKRLTIHFVRQSYVPMGVFKCLVKMAIAIMPEQYLSQCGHVAKWIREGKHSYESFPYRPLLALVQFTPLSSQDCITAIRSFDLRQGLPVPTVAI